jgi:hypothetical protein
MAGDINLPSEPAVRPIGESAASFDVYICYHGADRLIVANINQQLQAHGIRTWFDQEQLRPGIPWQRALEMQIRKIKAVAVFISENGRGPWQDLEIQAFLRQFVRRGCIVIPVLLPTQRTSEDRTARRTPRIPVFLQGFTWVDFRTNVPDPLTQLIWGITGRRKSETSEGSDAGPARNT